jgi:hypothetical protein
MYSDINRKTAHEIASAFLSFKYGLYGNAVSQAMQVISQLNDNEPHTVLKKALTILRMRAGNLENADVTPVTGIEFGESEQSYIAIHVLPEANEDPATLTLDNALILVYAVSLLTSEDDEQALDEHQNFIVGLLISYKRAMGL